MSFQQYCDSIEDGQVIKSEKTTLLTYTNSKSEVFSISPDSIKIFLEFFLDNFDQVYTAWNNTASRKDRIDQYEEKSYREIYKSASNDELKIISSSGKSQTKALTKLIAKLIAFLSNNIYESPESSTFFGKEPVSLALKNWSVIASSRPIPLNGLVPTERAKNEFKLWMIEQGLSERTASSYSGTGISLCDKYLYKSYEQESSLYQLSSDGVLAALERLRKIDEWVRADEKGNSMYSAACKKLAEFLSKRQYTPCVHLSKPFLLLAGISGTGKTRFVREQAKASGQFDKTYCLTSVRPDWHEPSDLLGYISHLSGTATYITTDVIKFIAKAWRGIISSGLSIGVEDGQGKRLVVTGSRDVLAQVSPYWLCLDEMNLAPVEQYFADYLSVLETREWKWSGESFVYSSDALLKPSIFEVVNQEALREALGFGSVADGEYNEVWAYICEHGLGIPFNLIVAGTVNMDETTHGFSRKVIDRALTFDFGNFFPNDLDDFFVATQEPKMFGFPIYSQAKKEMFSNVSIDKDVTKTRAFFEAINEVLKGTSFELAFRSFNELCLSVCSFAPQSDEQLQAAFDDFLMCKVLPRIEGDEDKLQGPSHVKGDNILEQLETVLAEELSIIWSGDRIDLMRKRIGTDEPARITCRSSEKIAYMRKLLSSGFTSFWP